MFNKKGDIESIIYIVMFIFIVGIIFFFVTHLNSEIFTGIEDVLNNSAGYNGTKAVEVATAFKEKNQSRLFDYAFLGVFLGCVIAMGLSAYAVRISPVFFWIYVLIAIIVVVLGTILSNAWQILSADANFITTLTYFPIMNAVLGSWYPIIVTVIITFFIIILFGKPSEGGI